MPKYLALSPEQAAAVKAAGADANEYVFDPESGDAVHRSELPPTTWGEEVTSGLKSIAPGAADALLAPVALGGSVADLIRQGVGTYDPNDPSALTSLARSGRSAVEGIVGQPDPQASWLSTGIGRGAGNLLGTMSGAGIARKGLSKLADISAQRIAGGLGGAMMAESAMEREMEQQGANLDPLKTAVKGTVSGLGGGYLEQKFGAGGLLKNLERPATSGLDALKRAGMQFLSGAGTEAGQQALENLLITGGPQLMDPQYSPLKAGAIGGLVQGPVSLGLDKAVGWSSPEEKALADKVNAQVAREQAEESGQPIPAAAPKAEGGLSGLMGSRGKKAPVEGEVETDIGSPMYTITPGTAEAMLKAGENWKPPISTPVDGAFVKLVKAGVAVTPDEIQDMYNAWGGKAEGVAAVERMANDIYAKHQLIGPSKPVDPLTQIGERQARRAEYSTQRKKLGSELIALQEELQKAPLGTQQVILAKIREVENDLQTIAQQEAVDLAALQPVLPTKGMNQPVIAAGALPGIGETGIGVGPKPAIELPGPIGETIGENYTLNREIGPQLPAEGPQPKPLGYGPKGLPPASPLGYQAPKALPLQAGGPILAGTSPAGPKLLPAKAGESSADYVRRVGLEAIMRAKAEGARLPAELEQALQGYREQQEGEQGSPFGETVSDEDAELSEPPKEYHSSFGPSKETLKALATVLRGLGFSPSTKSLDPFYKFTQSVTSRMASLSPAGGAWKWLHSELVREETKLLHALATAARPLEPFLKSEKGKAWVQRASTEKTWENYDGLSDGEAAQAQAVAEYITQLNEVMRSRGIRVQEIDANGKLQWRDRKDLPGYFPWTVGDQVYDAFAAGGKESEQLRDDFIAAWGETFGKGREAQAEAAMDNLLGVRGMEKGPGGEPLFGPVSLPHGMTLPESWRSKNPSENLNRYLKRLAKHMAWAEVVQYNPVGRVLMGLTNDPAGNDTSETDPKTWAEAPDMWKYAVREGKRARGEWASTAPEVAPDEPIRKFGDSKLLTAMLGSYKQASMPAAVMQAANSAASAAIMQVATGLRDVGMSAVLSAQYAGPVQALRSMLASIIEPGKKIEEARAAGAMPGDLLSPETELNARVVARGLMKFARGMRKISGREFLDNLGRTVIFDAVKSVILEGKGDHLVKEFGPVNADGLTAEQIAEQTAARISHRASNVADAGSLPEFMLPQSPMSWPFALARWSVSQYNNFSEDVVNPALRSSGKEQMRRFVTLMIGSVVAGSVINGLLDDLFKRKPDYLTWGEWLNVFGDDKVDNATKAKEFAYTAAARMQVMGALGWVGDYLIAPAARELAGGKAFARSTDIQYPAWIVALQTGDILGSYYNAMKSGRTDGSDFMDLLLELVKLNQNAKIAGAGLEAAGMKKPDDKKALRDQSVVERVFGVDTSSGRPVGPAAGQRPAFKSDPFNFTHQAMSGDLENMRGFLTERRKSGNVPSLDTWSQHRKYYSELERLVGEEEAKKQREKDRTMDREVRQKNREIRRLSR